MSAPDPKSWTPEPWEVSEVAMQSDSEFGDNDDSGIVALCESVARRRAIEELKALTEVYCDCSKNGGHGGHDADCQSGVLYDRIAAIEAEEA